MLYAVLPLSLVDKEIVSKEFLIKMQWKKRSEPCGQFGKRKVSLGWNVIRSLFPMPFSQCDFFNAGWLGISVCYELHLKKLIFKKKEKFH